MSKIVLDAREYTTSTGRYMYRLIQYLEQLESEHEFVVLLKPGDMDVYPFSNPRFTKLPAPHKEFTFQEQVGFWRQLRSLKPDLVHFGKDHQPVLYRGRVVTTMHDLTTARFRNPAKPWLVFKFKQLVYKQVIRLAARKSRVILTPTEFVKNDVVRFAKINPAKVLVTYEAADRIADEPVAVEGLEGETFIMYVGRPTPHKNLDRLIDAFVRLREQRPDVHLVLAGKADANYRRFADRVQKQSIPNVIFTGFISDGQLRWLYEHCTAYVFPSLSEGFGLPGLEAMAHGAPVVCSRATCLPEVYGDAAHYFDPLDVRDMAAKIGEVLDDPVLREDLIDRGHKQIQKYSWRRMAEQTLEVYNKVLKT